MTKDKNITKGTRDKTIGAIIAEVYRTSSTRDNKLDRIENALKDCKNQLDRLANEISFIKQDVRDIKIKLSDSPPRKD